MNNISRGEMRFFAQISQFFFQKRFFKVRKIIMTACFCFYFFIYLKCKWFYIEYPVVVQCDLFYHFQTPKCLNKTLYRADLEADREIIVKTENLFIKL